MTYYIDGLFNFPYEIFSYQPLHNLPVCVDLRNFLEMYYLLKMHTSHDDYNLLE